MLMPFAIIIYNMFAVIILTIYGNGDGQAKIDVKKLAKDIVTSPLIFASVLALALRMLPWKIPVVFTNTVSQLGSVASPLALLVLGANFDVKGFKSNIRTSVIAALLRLVVFPLAFILLALAFGMRGAQLGVVFILFGVPTAVSSHIMALNLGCDGELAGDILVCTTMLSMITMFLGIFILKTLALI